MVNLLWLIPLVPLLGAVINGFLAPPLLVVVMLVANNKAIMGERVNGRPANVVGWVSTLVMFAAAIGLLVTWGA